MRKIACPLCQTHADRMVWSRQCGPFTVTTVLCHCCGLVFHNPVLEDSDRQELGLSHRELHTDAAIRSRNLKRVAQRLTRQADFLGPVIQPGWQTLEVGAGLGLFSAWLRRQGCLPLAIEPDQQQAAFARQQFGLEIINRRFEETTLQQQFHFLAASHVIEHLPEPLEFLRCLHRLAAPAALLFLETPNILAPKVGPRRVFSLAHNFYFSPQTLTAALARTGWQVLRLRVFQRDSCMVVALRAEVQDCPPDPGHAQEVWQAIVRHRRVYYSHLLFLWRKIPWWQRRYMYRYQDFAGGLQPLNPSVSAG